MNRFPKRLGVKQKLLESDEFERAENWQGTGREREFVRVHCCHPTPSPTAVAHQNNSTSGATGVPKFEVGWVPRDRFRNLGGTYGCPVEPKTAESCLAVPNAEVTKIPEIAGKTQETCGNRASSKIRSKRFWFSLSWFESRPGNSKSLIFNKLRRQLQEKSDLLVLLIPLAP
jgi:hypothetical protein